MSSDPFEEFEFRPLTEGLGFHRKEDKKPVSSPSSFELKNNLPEIEMPLSSRGFEKSAGFEKSGGSFEKSSGSDKSSGFDKSYERQSSAFDKPVENRPIMRRSQVEETKSSDSTATVDEILKTLHNKRKSDFIEQRPQVEPQAPAYASSSPDISAFILDGMLVIAASLACLIVLLMVTKIDLFGVITQTEDDTVYFTLFGLVASVSWIYLVMNRVFLGFTPGEWVFDQRIGLPLRHGSADYSLRVVARASIVVFTGMVLVPLISMIMGRDFAGQWTGATLLKKV